MTKPVCRKKVVLGSQAWTVGRRNTTLDKECPFCEGAGKFTVGENKKVFCPKCHGARRVYDKSVTTWMSMGPYTVGMVKTILLKDLSRSDKGNALEEGWFFDFKDGYWCKSEYMMHETGVGSGSVYTHVFSSEKEAKSFTDEMNEREKKEKSHDEEKTDEGLHPD